MSFPAVVFPSWLVRNSFLVTLSLFFYTFVFTSSENMSLLPSLHMQRSAWRQSLIKILLNALRKVLKQLKKTLMQPVTIICLTGATAVGSVNANEFWQRWIWPPSFLLLLSCKMDLAIHSDLLFALASKWFTTVTVFATITFVLCTLMCYIPSK